MIRLFTLLKTNLNQLPSAMYLYETLSKGFKPSDAVCPQCGSFMCLAEHDMYGRWLVSYEDKSIQENRIQVRRFICDACQHTHAILPDVLVPYKSYCIIFILHVMKALFFRTETIRALAARFQISVTTIYAWKKRFLSHKSIDLGALERYFHEQDPALAQPERVCFTNLLHSFFQKFGFSFMQHHLATESRGP